MDETICPCCLRALTRSRRKNKNIKECVHCDAVVEYVSSEQREKDLKGTYEGNIVEE